MWLLKLKFYVWLIYISGRLRRIRKTRKKTKLPFYFPERTIVNIFMYFPSVSVKMSIFLSLYSLFQFVKQRLQGQTKKPQMSLKCLPEMLHLLMWKSWNATPCLCNSKSICLQSLCSFYHTTVPLLKNLYQKN